MITTTYITPSIQDHQFDYITLDDEYPEGAHGYGHTDLESLVNFLDEVGMQNQPAPCTDCGWYRIGKDPKQSDDYCKKHTSDHFEFADMKAEIDEAISDRNDYNLKPNLRYSNL